MANIINMKFLIKLLSYLVQIIFLPLNLPVFISFCNRHFLDDRQGNITLKMFTAATFCR